MKSPIIILTMALLFQTFTGYAIDPLMDAARTQVQTPGLSESMALRIARLPQYSFDPTVEQIGEFLAQNCHVQPARPDIRKSIEGILNKCGITRHVIIVERSNGIKDSFNFSMPTIHPQEFLAIDIRQTTHQMEAATYHEIGHLYHGHAQLSQIKKDKIFNFSYNTATLALMGLSFIQSPFESKIINGIIACGTGLCSFIAKKYVNNYKESFKETQADEFAISKLLEHDRLHIALALIYDFLIEHKTTPKEASLSPFISGYPTSLNRARKCLQIIEKHGYKIANLINNLPKQSDPGLKKHFPGFIKEFLPEFLGN